MNFTRIPFFHILRDQFELDMDTISSRTHNISPDLLIEALSPTMEVMFPMITRELIVDVIDTELPIRDAIRHTSDGRSEVSFILGGILVIEESYLFNLAVLVCKLNGSDTCAKT